MAEPGEKRINYTQNFDMGEPVGSPPLPRSQEPRRDNTEVKERKVVFEYTPIRYWTRVASLR